MNHIVFCINNNWVMPVTVLIKSILFNNPEDNFTFHVISKFIDDDNLKKLETELTEKSLIKYYFISNEYDKKFIIRKKDHVSVETYYRFFIPELLPAEVDKVLYLDADILCCGKVKDLFDIDLTNKACGMVFDIRYGEIMKYNRLNYNYKYKYYNAGMMLLNLKYWREHEISSKLIDYAIANKDILLSHDQDAINALLHEDIYEINPKYNFQMLFFRVYAWLHMSDYSCIYYNQEKIEKKYWNDISEAQNNLVFVHYNLTRKPWHKEADFPFTELWRCFYKNTIFRSNSFKSFRKSFFKHIYYRIKQLIYCKIKKQSIYSRFPEFSYEVEKKYINAYMNINDK